MASLFARRGPLRSKRIVSTAGLAAVLLTAVACSSTKATPPSGSTAAAAGASANSSSTATSSTPASSAPTSTTKVVEQLGWLGDYEQAGEAVALAKGWYKQKGIDLVIQQGGPNIDGVSSVASGRATIGQTSSSPAIMLAVSQGEPLKAIASALQKHPFTYYSLPGKPVKTPQDLVGKTVGTQATAQILLHALEAKNSIAQNKVPVKVIGSDVTPLTTHQVDVWTGWATDQASLSKIKGGYQSMALWDAGIHLYALVYFTNNNELSQHPQVLANFLAATGQGWGYAAQHPEEAAQDVLKLYPNLKDESAQLASLKMLISQFLSSSLTASSGWGAMDPSVWQSQIDEWAQLGQFSKGTPTVDQVMTTSVLDATASERPKLSPQG